MKINSIEDKKKKKEKYQRNRNTSTGFVVTSEPRFQSGTQTPFVVLQFLVASSVNFLNSTQ